MNKKNYFDDIFEKKETKVEINEFDGCIEAVEEEKENATIDTEGLLNINDLFDCFDISDDCVVKRLNIKEIN